MFFVIKLKENTAFYQTARCFFRTSIGRLIKAVPLFVLDNEAKLMYLTFERSGEIGVYDLVEDCLFAIKPALR